MWEFHTCDFIKKETPTQVFFCEFSKIFKNTSFYRTPPVAAFEIYFERSVLGFVKHLLLKVEVKHWAAMYCS